MAQCAIGRYTGNDVNGRQITGVGFQPTGLLIFHESIGSGFISLMTPSFPGAGCDTIGNIVDQVASLDTDGFTLNWSSTAAGVNKAPNGFNWVAFRDDAATNYTHGTYTGDGTPTRQITVGFIPTIVWCGTPDRGMIFWTKTLNTLAYGAPSTGWIDGSWLNGFVVSGLNVNAREYQWMAWKTAQNFCDEGKYTGNNTDNRDIVITSPTWQPKVVVTLCRQTLIGIIGSGVGRWHSDAWSTGDSTQQWAGTSGTQPNSIQKKNVDGFQIGTEANVNYLNEIYDWFCFGGAVPLVTSPNIPPTRRPSGYSGITTGNPGDYEFHKAMRKANSKLSNLVLGD
jgi:hypothetical protein